MQKTVAIIAVVVVIGAGVYFLTSPVTTPTEPAAETVTRTTEPETPVATPEPDPTGTGNAAEDMATESAARTTEPEPPAAGTPSDEPVAAGNSDSGSAIAAATPYTVAVSYLTPSRTSHDMDVTLVVDANGRVTDASIVYDNGAGFSNGHQERFDGAYRDLVVGQQLSEIDLSTVGGASLTTTAFNNAVDKILEQSA